MVVVSHLFLFYGKISGADVTWYESHLPLFGTIYFPIAPYLFIIGKDWCITWNIELGSAIKRKGGIL